MRPCIACTCMCMEYMLDNFSGLLESSRVQGDTVSGVGDDENMCVLSVEWSETIVSCGGSVTYSLTVTPCPSGSGDCDMNDMTFSGLEENQHSFTVNGSVSLEYELTLLVL